MEFNIGKFVGDAQQAAGAFINRAKQVTLHAFLYYGITFRDGEIQFHYVAHNSIE